MIDAALAERHRSPAIRLGNVGVVRENRRGIGWSQTVTFLSILQTSRRALNRSAHQVKGPNDDDRGYRGHTCCSMKVELWA